MILVSLQDQVITFIIRRSDLFSEHLMINKILQDQVITFVYHKAF